MMPAVALAALLAWPASAAESRRELLGALRRLRGEALGAAYAAVGRYEDAHRAFDTDGRARDTRKAGELDLIGLRAERAVDAIRKAASGRRAVFLNEAPHVPQHRALVRQLLSELRLEGYRYFAVEALSGPDEPLRADLVREARRLDYRVVSYEHPEPCVPRSGDDRLRCRNERELGQAKKLHAQIFKNDPRARAIVLAGYGHIDENGGDGWEPMAKRFKALSGIDPLTIDQTAWTERSDRKLESPFYRAAVKKLKIEEASLLVDDKGPISRAPGSYDVQVIHPRSRYHRGRPQWLFDAFRHRIELPKGLCGKAAECLVEARFAGEPELSVPADRLLIRRGEDSTLALPLGKFRVEAYDARGRRLGVASVASPQD